MAGIPSIGFAQSSASGVSLSNSINDTFSPSFIIGSSESEIRSSQVSEAKAEGTQTSKAEATNTTPSLFGGGGSGGGSFGSPTLTSGYSSQQSAAFNPFADEEGKNNTVVFLAIGGVLLLAVLKMKKVI